MDSREIQKLGTQSAKAEVSPSGEPGVGVNRKGRVERRSSMSSAGGSQKRRKSVVREESADTQEYESCQQSDMEVDRDEGMEELSFISSAVSESAVSREPVRIKYMCDKKCNKEGFKFYDIAAVLVEDDGKTHTINLCGNCNPEADRKKRIGCNQRELFWRLEVGRGWTQDTLVLGHKRLIKGHIHNKKNQDPEGSCV